MFASTTSAGTIFEQMARLMKWVTADADRLHQRPDSFGADEPAAIEELFHVGVFTGAWAEKFPEQACAQ